MKDIFKISIFVLTLFLAAPVFAEDVEGSKDNPRVPRLSGYEIVRYQMNDFSKYDFYKSEEEMVTKEGRFWKIEYRMPENGKIVGPLEIARNYEGAFKAKGGDGYDGDIYEGGGTAYAWMNEDGKETWLEISIADAGEDYELTIVETAALKQQVEIGAEQIAKELTDKGSIALYGINFDTGKSDITPGSEKTLADIATALKSVPDMKIEVGGHTDNVGGAEYNQNLSQERAAAVTKALTRQGIDAARLTAKGYGDTKPVGDNETDAGRAKNRRVELVRLP